MFVKALLVLILFVPKSLGAFSRSGDERTLRKNAVSIKLFSVPDWRRWWWRSFSLCSNHLIVSSKRRYA